MVIAAVVLVSASAAPGASRASATARAVTVDPCQSRYPSGSSKTTKGTLLTRTAFDRQASLLQVCEGFGAPDSSGFTLTPAMQCAIIAAAATFGGPVVNAGADTGCDTVEISGQLRNRHWLGAAKSAACSYFSDIFATAAGVFAAGATAETGPGAVAVGVNTYRALLAGLKLACGGVLTHSATEFGVKLEAKHETAVAVDIIRHGRCLHETRKVGIGIQWSAVACQPQATGAVTLATFAGTWFAHTASLKITSSGYATESIGSGCCDPIIDLTFRISHPGGTAAHATALVTATSVTVRDPTAFTPPSSPAPHVGQTGILSLKAGIITEPLTWSIYCDREAGATGVCGA